MLFPSSDFSMTFKLELDCIEIRSRLVNHKMVGLKGLPSAVQLKTTFAPISTLWCCGVSVNLTVVSKGKKYYGINIASGNRIIVVKENNIQVLFGVSCLSTKQLKNVNFPLPQNPVHDTHCRFKKRMMIAVIYRNDRAPYL